MPIVLEVFYYTAGAAASAAVSLVGAAASLVSAGASLVVLLLLPWVPVLLKADTLTSRSARLAIRNSLS